MRLSATARTKGEGGLALVVIVLLILGGLAWWIYTSRQDAEKNIRIFANEVTTRVTVNHDAKFLYNHLSREGQAQLMRSWQDRLFEQLRSLGVPAQPFEVEGQPEFNSWFFDPHGNFRAHLKYPTTTAELELGLSRGMTAWQVDTISVIWTPPPTPTPGPTPVATPTPPPEKTKRKAR